MARDQPRRLQTLRAGLTRGWRAFRRREQPRRLPVVWLRHDLVSLLLACGLVAVLSVWPWVVQPTLRPGLPAPFDARAPRAASVVDREALEQRRSQLGPRLQVQVPDVTASQQLQQRLDRLLQELLQAVGPDQQEQELPPLPLTAAERAFLEETPDADLEGWSAEVQIGRAHV